MDASAGIGLVERTSRHGGSRRRRAPLGAALLALLTLCGIFVAAAPAFAAPDSARATQAFAQAGKTAKPGRPTAKTPVGTIASTTPTFAWSKAKGAAKYELRVYQGKSQVLKKTGLKKRSWKSTTALPAGVDLTWKVRGKSARGTGAWSKSLTFRIAAAPSSAKAITTFGFASPAATGVIDQTLHTIAVSVPSGTNVGALVATFSTTGSTVKVAGVPQVSGTTANDFSGPVTYTVTAADASTQTYVVTVTVASGSAKAITAFGFASPAATGVIDRDAAYHRRQRPVRHRRARSRRDLCHERGVRQGRRHLPGQRRHGQRFHEPRHLHRHRRRRLDRRPTWSR